MKNVFVNRAFTAKKNIHSFSNRSTFVLSILLVILTAFTTNVRGETETISISDIASANSWESGKHYSGWTSADGKFTFTANNTAQGLYYSSDNSWRGYKNKGEMVITAASGVTISSVTSSATASWAVASGGGSASFTPTATIKFTSFTITYTSSSGGSTYTVTLDKNGNTSDITDCSGTYTLPTTGEHVADACEGWAWHCWTNAAYAESTTAPSSTKITTMSNAGTAYAVYKHTETAGGSSDITFTAGTDEGSTTSTNADEMAKSGITISSTSAGLAYAEYRFYSGKITISSSLGNISSVVFTCTTDAYATVLGNITPSTGSISSSGTTATWTGSASSFTLANSAQSRVSSIVVTVGGGTTTTYTSTPDCVECLTKVTLTKGEESHGTFTLDKSDGEYNNCTSNFVVTVSGITPDGGYYCTGVTATGGHNAVTGPDGSGNYTVTYEKGNAVTSIITANFSANPTYTVTWSMDGDNSNTEEYIEGATINFPATATGCSGKAFIGWSAVEVEETDTKPALVKSATMGTSPITYYAVYATEEGGGGGSGTYEKATDLAAGDFVIFVCEDAKVEMTSISASSTKYGVGTAYSDSPVGTFVFEVEEGSESGTFAFKNGNKYLYWGSNNTLNLYGSSAGDNQSWTVSIAANGNATISNVATSSRRIVWNSSNSALRFAAYNNPTIGSTYYAIQLYKQTGSYSAYTTSCGASISAKNVGWITAAKGQKVKRTISVSASGFDEETTLTAVSSNPQFTAALAETVVPAGNAGLSTTLTVEYLPTEAETTDENVSITLSAGGLTKTITVSGRSLPNEFLIITKKGDTWYALPANMNEGPDEYDGVAVVPNDATTPTGIEASPSTLIYRLFSVAEDRYLESGHRVLLAGFDNLCLWSNMVSSTGKENIQNSTNVASANTKYFEWLLTTTDGIRYTIANPDHPHYEAGRRLAYGSKFGMYIGETEFYLIPAGCTTQPQDVLAKPRRVDVTISWVSNASEMTIDIWDNEGMSGAAVTSVTATSSPKVVTGLEETTDYWFKLTPSGGASCAVTGSFTTTGPTIDVVEWKDDAVVIFVDKDEDLHPKIVIDGEVEHGIGSGAAATELFFSKYFEGSGSMKLIAIFNGTSSAINLADYKIVLYHGSSSNKHNDSENKTWDLSTYGSIAAGQEIIFFTRPSATNNGEKQLAECSDNFISSIEDKSDEKQRWIECTGGDAMTFNGNDAMFLTKSDNIIDVIGAINDGISTTETIPNIEKNCRNENSWSGTATNMDYNKTVADFPNITLSGSETYADYGVNMTDPLITVYTARCILFRDKTVTSGEKAVALNTTDFVTLSAHTYLGDDYPSEWNARYVCTSTARCTELGWTYTIGSTTYKDNSAATCNSYQDLGEFDYSQYYKDWENVVPEKDLDDCEKNTEEKTYTMSIDNLAQFSCLNVRFQLTDPDDVTHVLTETPVQVPIIVKDGHHTTDGIFNSIMKKDNGDPAYDLSIERCKTCDVVILGDGVLTKATDGAEHDVPQIGNLKIYPGGQLIVPSGTNYKVNSLSFRRQEDEVPYADVQGTLNITGGDDNVYLDLRVDPTSWHFITLPYDCKVSDITFANGDPTPPVLGTDFLLMKYDGALRAATRNDRSWVNVAADETLKKGLGYIYSLPGGGKVKRELRFPMANEVITPAVERADKLIESVYGYGCDKTDEELRPNHKGWNLIGDPYLLKYKTDFTAPLATGYLEHTPDPWDGKWQIREGTEALYYIVEPVYDASGNIEEYIQVDLPNYEMKPFTSYFVQIGGTDPTAPQGIEFTATGSDDWRHSSVRRNRVEYEDVEDTHPVWCAVDLISPDGEKDETTLLVSDDFTDNYDMMRDLVKMRSPYYTYYKHTVLASRNNEGEMAFNALPDASAAAGVPLNFFAASGGEYTFTYNDKYGREDVQAVMLHDKQLGQWHDLLAEPYTFSTFRTDDTERFVLSVRVDRKKAPQSITEIEEGTQTNGPRKILINEHVYILRDGKVYDVTGKQMSNL